jgi:hypothetical protein
MRRAAASVMIALLIKQADPVAGLRRSPFADMTRGQEA